MINTPIWLGIVKTSINSIIISQLLASIFQMSIDMTEVKVDEPLQKNQWGRVIFQ
jgi:hypothetical protein